VAAQLHINQRWAANKGLHHAPRTHAHTRRSFSRYTTLVLRD